MSGAKNSFKKREKKIAEYIELNSETIYSNGFMPAFDLRGYINYIESHKIPIDKITESIAHKFFK